MTKSTKNKSMDWLKGVLSKQNQFENNLLEEDDSSIVVDEMLSFVEETQQLDLPNQKQLFSKENQDKVSLDLIIAVENMLNDRQLTEYKNKDLEDQLYSSNEMINRLKHDLMKKDKHILEKNKEINALEGKLTKKQMSYDQLIEDYKDYQNTSKNEFEKISNLLEKEISKYEKLNDLSTKTQYQNMIKIKDLEERIRDLEVENQKYAEQYQKIVEKNELLQSINDFTERMSFSFSPKNVEATSLTK
jgi:DNA repair exonuclease SbcCD ATPase subunit